MPRFTCVLIHSLFVSLLIGASCAWAESGRSDYDLDNDGLIEVNDLRDLDEIRNNLDGSALYGSSAGCPVEGCVGFELTADLDFDTNGDGEVGAADDYWDDGKGWQPIGTSHAPLTAHVEGNNHRIENLRINRGSDDNVGLFSSVQGVSLRRIEITTNSHGVIGSDHVGVLVGMSTDSSVSEIYVEGRVHGEDEVGVLVGNANSTSIKAVATAGLVQATSTSMGTGNAGGIFGRGDSGTTLTAVQSTALVYSSTSPGGLAGALGNGIAASLSLGKLVDANGQDFRPLGGQGDLTDSYWLIESGVSKPNFRVGFTYVNSDAVALAELQCPVSSDDTNCSSVPLYTGWSVYTNDAGKPYWDFGTENQLPGLNILGRIIRDSDGDGVYDHLDAWPDNSSYGKDADNDGYPDEYSWLCDELCQQQAVLGIDYLPGVVAAHLDEDMDGYPEAWNPGCDSSCQLASGLELDLHPNDFDNDGINDLIDTDDNGDDLPDADADSNGLVGITSLNQFNQIRFELLGHGRRIADDSVLDSSGCPVRLLDRRPQKVCRGYELLSDLDFDTDQSGSIDAADDFWNEGEGWQPIGNYTVPYTAVFEGNNHKIKNLYINRLSNYQGLFGGASGATIRRLAIVGDLNHIDTNRYSSTGFLVGYATDIQVREVFVDGAILAGTDVGLIAGTAWDSEFIACAAAGSVEAISTRSQRAGGLVGYGPNSRYIASLSSAHITGEDVGGFSGSYGDAEDSLSLATGVSSSTAYGAGFWAFSGGQGEVENSFWPAENNIEKPNSGNRGSGSFSAPLSDLKCHGSTQPNLCSDLELYTTWPEHKALDGFGYWAFGTTDRLPALRILGGLVGDLNGDGELALDTTAADLLDSDGDQIPDVWEMSHGLDPVNFADVELDSDLDTVTNYDEYLAGSDPSDPTDPPGAAPDTDHDGLIDLLDDDDDNDKMPDEYEREHGLNPVVYDADQDVDSDGLSNLDEYNYGSSPSNYDTDGDRIPDGYEFNHGLSIAEPNPEAFAEYLASTYPHDYRWISTPTNLGSLGDSGVLMDRGFWVESFDGKIISSARTQVLDEARVIWSVDGLSWSKSSYNFQNDGVNHFLGLAYSGSTYVLLGWRTDGGLYIYTSSDLNNWTLQAQTKRSKSDWHAASVAWGGDRFVVVGAADPSLSHSVIMTSADGTNWAEYSSANIDWSNLASDYQGKKNNFLLGSVAYGYGKFVAVGPYGLVLESTDGASWSAVNWRSIFTDFQKYPGNGYEPSLDWVSFNGSEFLINRGATSADGINWKGPSEDLRITHATWTGSEWVGWAMVNAVNLSSNVWAADRHIYRSSNGRDWTLEYIVDEKSRSDESNVWDLAYFYSIAGRPYYFGSDNQRYERELVDEDGDGIGTRYELLNGLDVRADDAALDADSDGITNLQEFLDGTRADVADTDGDGLSDSEEKTVGTDPLKTDSDSDGMPDGFELSNGFNPLDVADAALDQDGDNFSNMLEFLKGSDPADINSKPFVIGDFDGDSNAEIFWRSGSSVSLRLLAGAAANPVASATLSSTWKPESFGDYNGDGKTDVIWRHKDGRTKLWLMDGETVVEASDTSRTMTTAWQLIGSGDFDGDRKSDLLWFNPKSRTSQIWFMDGATVSSYANTSKRVAAGYQPKAVDDFDGNGRADIGWFKPDTRHTRIWLMDGNQVVADQASKRAGRGFAPAASGDFNLDGKSDWLWRHSDGRTQLWQLDGARVSSSAFTSLTKPASWRLRQVGDFNGDGKSDLLWSYRSSNHIWYMNGAEVVDTDLDADGLSSAEEQALGSNDRSADSDGDGYLDAYEVNVAALNPTVDDRVADSDGDGISNIDEHLLGTNYNSDDSDSDGILDGYERDNGLDPLVDDAAADLDSDGLSNVTEAGLGTRADLADTDGDGLSDFVENRDGTNPLLADSDGDSMNDGFEVLYSLNPNSAADAVLDPDGDGYSNLLEHNKGSDPTDVASFPYVQDDFDRDGDAETFWRSGSSASLRLLAGRRDNPKASATLASSWKMVDRGDYNGDRKTDVLWRYKDGRTKLWLMDGETVLGSVDTSRKMTTAWEFAGSGDFDGDGKSDLLWFNPKSRTSHIWFMDGHVVSTYGNTNKRIATGYKPAAIGDFDGNGRDDIAWFKADTRDTRIWLMEGRRVAQDGAGKRVGRNLSVVDGGDFNGDGKTDLLLRHSDGRTQVWLMDGANRLSSAYTSMNKPASWALRAVADYNGDRKADLLWFYRGRSHIWYLDGTTVAAVDSDADGLDDAFETAQGSSVSKADGDGDGVLDSYELLWRAAGFDPMVDDTVADTDGDGLSNLREHELGSNHNAKDSDSDGMEDGYEARYGLDLNSNDANDDPDLDNLTNAEEAVLGTNPTLADTDGDGLNDDVEVAAATNPLKTDSDDDGMDDEFEWYYGLDSTLDDTRIDSDTDGHSNWKEYLKGSAPNDANSQPYVAGDLDADGDAEVIEQNGDGVLLWYLGHNFTTYDAGGASNGSSDWVLQGWHDFNGDQKADLVWRHKTSGALRLWFMDGTSVLSQADVEVVKQQTWRLEGMGDFNADGVAEILWRHKTNGKAQVWLMWGATVNASTYLSSQPSKDYKFAGIGDFDGDYYDDILWRHKDGRTFVWYMNAAKVKSKRQTSHKLANTWVAEGIADFNGDGNADILWRNDSRLLAWEMSGHTRLRSYTLPGQASKSQYKLIGFGDYVKDGYADIFWQQKGQVGAGTSYSMILDGEGGLLPP